MSKSNSSGSSFVFGRWPLAVGRRKKSAIGRSLSKNLSEKKEIRFNAKLCPKTEMFSPHSIFPCQSLQSRDRKKEFDGRY
jgi:hypothetical protein